MRTDYKKLLKSKRYKVAVWGTGYIGLSTMVYFSKKKIKCTNFEVYKSQLKKLHVILDPKERKNKILDNLEEFCRNNNLKFTFEEGLIERVSNSVERPNLFFGSFDNKYFISCFLHINILINIIF